VRFVDFVDFVDFVTATKRIKQKKKKKCLRHSLWTVSVSLLSSHVTVIIHLSQSCTGQTDSDVRTRVSE